MSKNTKCIKCKKLKSLHTLHYGTYWCNKNSGGDDGLDEFETSQSVHLGNKEKLS